MDRQAKPSIDSQGANKGVHRRLALVRLVRVTKSVRCKHIKCYLETKGKFGEKGRLPWAAWFARQGSGACPTLLGPRVTEALLPGRRHGGYGIYQGSQDGIYRTTRSP